MSKYLKVQELETPLVGKYVDAFMSKYSPVFIFEVNGERQPIFGNRDFINKMLGKQFGLNMEISHNGYDGDAILTGVKILNEDITTPETNVTLSLSQTAEKLGVTSERVAELNKFDFLKPINTGKNLLYRLVDIEEAMKHPRVQNWISECQARRRS